MKHELISGKTVDDAINKAIVELMISSDQLEYVIVDRGSSGILGIGSRPAVIEAWAKETMVSSAESFLQNMFKTMGMEVNLIADYNEEERTLNLDLQGEDMGILIGKRGQTLDSLQYLVSLVVNKGLNTYVHVKADTENYRERRKKTLGNLAKNVASKVKRTRRPQTLEAMNPYERRVIHSALQGDRYVTTYSEGEEPFRHVVVTMKKDDRYDREDQEQDFAEAEEEV